MILAVVVEGWRKVIDHDRGRFCRTINREVIDRAAELNTLETVCVGPEGPSKDVDKATVTRRITPVEHVGVGHQVERVPLHLVNEVFATLRSNVEALSGRGARA